ncbi:hypothetical protein RD792_009357 [Penstemon davidsonii]|uniref:Sodium/hydrogen exchanger n=1 Tax=Penstemon davidsonii TaxID=160366 RepID=A0ABR0CZR5_9LAMI|nr:hypothetical protein RD792_009357 [Penstemon davidsonii]
MGVGLGSALIKLGDLSSDSDQVSVESIVLAVGLLCVCILIGHLLEKARWINESDAALFIGLFTGFIILLKTHGKSSRILQFDEELFFIYLLPPIIFNAGFQVKKKHFFRNFMTITLFGAAGTLISFCIISFGAKLLFEALDIADLELRDYLAIGAIFSATDSVCTLQVLNQNETPLLYSLVFGEGVVNDATSVVLFNAIQKFDLSQINSMIVLKFVGDFFYLFLTSTLLGVMIGLLCAFIIKRLYFGRNSADREIALMILMAYLSYIMAELFNLSGILTVFFCGIVMSHYTWHNITEQSRVTTMYGFETMSFIGETFIFFYVGMDALDIEKWRLVSSSPWKPIGASAILLGLVLIGRASLVFPMSYLSNLAKKSKNDSKLKPKQQVTIWWAGLMRGAVSMALAYNQFAKSGHTQEPGNAIMITCTITIVLFSTVVFGSLTKPLVRSMFPRSNHQDIMVSSEPSSPNSSLTLPLLADRLESEGGDVVVSIKVLSNPTHTLHHYWKKFDKAIMRPVFGGK